MPNGNIYGGSGRQPVFSVQYLEDDSSYFIFTIDKRDYPFLDPHDGFTYSILDMRLDGGMGDIVSGKKKMKISGAHRAMSALSGTRHQNNHFAWVVVRLHHPDSNFYASYLIDQDGLDTVPVYSQSLIHLDNSTNSLKIMTLRISPDGKKLVCAYSHEYGTGFIEVCSFNALTGNITPLFIITPTQNIYNPYAPEFIEFSIDSRFLYVSAYTATIGSDHSALFQYDANNTDSITFKASEIFLGIHTQSAIQMAPDGKIYGTEETVDSLSIIHNPSLQGLACNYEINALWLQGNSAKLSLPQYLQRYYVYPHSTGHCQGRPVYFSMTVWPPADSAWWNFGDPGSGPANISNDFEPTHVFNDVGIYDVELIVRHNDKRFDTAWMTVEIHQTPQPLLGPDQTICQGDSLTLDAGTCTGCIYAWNSIPPGFTSTEQTVTLLQSGIYTVAVSSTNGCIGYDTIQLTVTASPIITNSPLFKSICSGEATSIPLTSNLPGTSFSWNTTSSSPSIIGFGPGNGDTINQFLTNTGTISETVTYTITPSLGDCEGDSVEYVVTVTPGDSVLVSISASDDSICQGTQISYIATPTQGGSAPGYQWKVNGVNQGTNNSVYNYTPSNHDTVCCILTSSDTVCISNNPATSNEIIMTVYPDLPVIISISTTNNPVCEGSTATFAATTSNKGTSPDFQWVVNGNVVGADDSTYSYVPVPGDQVFCVLTSSEQCASNNPATSDTITLIVNPLLPVGISISASENPVCEGLPVTFTATPVNGGAMPAYQWQVNGINTGTNNPGFTYTPVDGDLVTCTLTSNAECITNNPATSNSITMSVGESPDVNFAVCFDTITTVNAKPFKLKGGIPLGGTYSGPGVNQITGYFNPAMAGVGLKTISYSYTNLFNCSNNATRAISVINPAPFSCGDSLTDIRDNKKYPTIQIGSQCWLAVNLNHGQQIGGTLAQRDNCLVEKYCYNDLPANCTQYGALYQWDELMRHEDYEEIQGLCSPGWHVPSEADWNQLFTVYQGNAFAGSPLLYTGYSGFNVLLAGVKFFNQSNRFVDFASIMWSSTSHGPYKAWSHGLNEYNNSVSYYPSYRSNAFSVRCIRN